MAQAAVKQRVIVAKPPVYDRCVHVFGREVIVGKPIIWSWGEVIYNPMDIDIPRELFAHEAVHGARQLADVKGWWDKYLTDVVFRYDEELRAHRAEWRNWTKWHPREPAYLRTVAEKLASPLYGSLVSAENAEAAVVGRF